MLFLRVTYQVICLKVLEYFVNLDNFFRFSKFSGMDPEAGMTDDAYYKYPVPKKAFQWE